jgi:hypothetical protein
LNFVDLDGRQDPYAQPEASRSRPAPRQPRRLSSFALECAATCFGILAVAVAVARKVLT